MFSMWKLLIPATTQRRVIIIILLAPLVKGGCISNCTGLNNTDYQLCYTCTSFATCSNQYLYVMPCSATLVFDDISKTCQPTSRTCSGDGIYVTPTEEPSTMPTEEPSTMTTEEPSAMPTEEPSTMPTEEPSTMPTEEPSTMPTEEPSTMPIEELSTIPTEEPSAVPTAEPSIMPTVETSTMPTEETSTMPTEEQSTVPMSVSHCLLKSIRNDTLGLTASCYTKVLYTNLPCDPSAVPYKETVGRSPLECGMKCNLDIDCWYFRVQVTSCLMYLEVSPPCNLTMYKHTD